MSNDLARRADERFARALDETGARDPREFYRGLLRTLKEQSEPLYREMVARYEEAVVATVGGGDADPLEAWLAFGVELAGRMHPGRTVVISEDGRAAPLAPPPRWDALVLHLPDEARTRAVPVSIPPEPSAAQRATVDLLVHGKVRLPE